MQLIITLYICLWKVTFLKAKSLLTTLSGPTEPYLTHSRTSMFHRDDRDVGTQH